MKINEILEQMYNENFKLTQETNSADKSLIETYFNKYGAIYLARFFLIPFVKGHYEGKEFSINNLIDTFNDNITGKNIIQLYDYNFFLSMIWKSIVTKFEAQIYANFVKTIDEKYPNFNWDWKLGFSEEEIFLLACDKNWKENQTYIKIKLLGEIFSNFKKNQNRNFTLELNDDLTNSKKFIEIKKTVSLLINYFKDNFIFLYVAKDREKQLDKDINENKIYEWFDKFSLNTFKQLFQNLPIKDKLSIISNFNLDLDDLVDISKINFFLDLFERIIKIRNLISHNKPIYKYKVFDDSNNDFYDGGNDKGFLTRYSCFFKDSDLNNKDIFLKELRILPFLIFTYNIFSTVNPDQDVSIFESINEQTNKLFSSIKNDDSIAYIKKKIGWNLFENFINSLKK